MSFQEYLSSSSSSVINTNRCVVLAKLKHLSLFSITQSGISSLSSCGNVQTLPELPPGEEVRLQRASKILQQKLILREWLKENRLQQYYSRYRNDSSTLLLHFHAKYFQINFDRGSKSGGCLLARGYVNQECTYTKGFITPLFALRFSSKSNIGQRFRGMESSPPKASNIESSAGDFEGRALVDRREDFEPQRCLDLRGHVGGLSFSGGLGDIG